MSNSIIYDRGVSNKEKRKLEIQFSSYFFFENLITVSNFEKDGKKLAYLLVSIFICAFNNAAQFSKRAFCIVKREKLNWDGWKSPSIVFHHDKPLLASKLLQPHNAGVQPRRPKSGQVFKNSEKVISKKNKIKHFIFI